MSTIVDFLERTVALTPHATYAVYHGRRFSFQEINEWANRIANGLLDAGYVPGEKIGLICSNRPGFLCAYFGILKLGAIPTILATNLTARDLIHELGSAEATGLFTYEGIGNTQFLESVLTAQKDLGLLRNIWLIPSMPDDPSPDPEIPSIADLASGQSARFRSTKAAPDPSAAPVYIRVNRPCQGCRNHPPQPNFND
ncbi:MAG: class I adenylate-forming enzyme family protein [Alphaproteobacteria bacterium]